jgi:hypothetical protein
VIPTLLHGIADYVVGIVVVSLPFMFGWAGALRWVALGLGLVVLLVALTTDYELGLYRIFRIRFHLAFDALFGLVMLAVPWTVGTPQGQSWPFYLIGVFALAVSFLTEIRPKGTAEQTI